MANSYQIIWERVRVNPNKGVPVDIVDAYVNRVIKAVKNCKCEDKVHTAMKARAGITGLMFTHRAKHPTNNALVRVTFLLREFHTTNVADAQYLKFNPPSVDLVKKLGLESIDPVLFGSQTKDSSSVYTGFGEIK